MNFKVVSGTYYEQLFQRLNGRGVTDLDREMDELVHERLLAPLGEALDYANLLDLAEISSETGSVSSQKKLIEQNLSWLDQADSAARAILGYPAQDREIAHQSWIKQLEVLTSLQESSQRLGLAASKTGKDLSNTLLDEIDKDPRRRMLLLVWNFFSNLAGSIEEETTGELNRQIADRRPVSELITAKLKEFGFSDYEAYRGSQAVRWLLNQVPSIEEETSSQKFLESLLRTRFY